MKLPPAMMALVLASKLDLKENESQKIGFSGFIGWKDIIVCST